MTLTNKIFLALILGVALGSFLNQFFPGSPNFLKDTLSVLGNIFISSLKMLIVPVVFFSIVCGVANLGNTTSLGRIGGKSIFLYLFSTFIAISLALLFANLIEPGSNASFNLENEFKVRTPPPISSVFESLIPSNPIKALAEGNMLQIICFAVILGITLNQFDNNYNLKLKKAFDSFNLLFLKMIDVIMYFAPYGVFVLIFRTFLTQGFSTIAELASYFFTVLIVLIIHFFITYGSLIMFFTKIKIKYFYSKMRKAILFAFSTSSSAATIPVTLKTVEGDLGVDKSVASFSVPLGATINMDGTALYQAIAAVFIAQTFGLDLSLGAQLGIILTATLASIGAAAVPSAGIIVLVIVLSQAGIPEAGLALIFAVDRPLDMCRTVVNISGDATVSMLVEKLIKKK